MTKIIEWGEDGYPTEASLWCLRKALKDKDYKKAIMVFYEASDYYDPECVEVRGEVIDVWAYHTGGWFGNESIIAILERETWLFYWLLERYDRGGYYYFRPIEQVLKVAEQGLKCETAKEG